MTDEQASIQAAAKRVLTDLECFITAEQTEASIAGYAQQRLAEEGYPETWYYNCHALVLLGDRSCLSISGKNYKPLFKAVGDKNLVTVDLSPCRGSLWGDCARSYAVEDGRVAKQPADPAFADGLKIIQTLHREVVGFIDNDTTFEELYVFANDRMTSLGYENLDFLGNLGHSIAGRLDDRIYIEQGNCTPLRSVPCFTFEPHIRIKGGQWGYKHEEIYTYQSTGGVTAL